MPVNPAESGRPPIPELVFPSPEQLTNEPLTEADRPWMQQLGFRWDTEPETAAEVLEWLNKLVTIGSQQQNTHPNMVNEGIRQARAAFLEQFPIAYKAQAYAGNINSHYRGRLSPIPLDGIVGTMRLLHGLGLHVGELTSIWRAPSTIQTRPDQAIIRMQAAAADGINPLVAIKRSPYMMIGIRPELRRAKLRVGYAIARAAGLDDYKDKVKAAFEARPEIFEYSTTQLRLMGRIGLAMFREMSPDQAIDMSDYTTLMRGSALNSVAAYLERNPDRKIGPRRGLAPRVRELYAYTEEERLGFLLYHQEDPIVKAYFRTHPISDEDAARLPRYAVLPARYSADAQRNRAYGAWGFRTATQAPDRRTLIRALTRLDRVNTGELDLDAEPNHDLRKRMFDDVDRGRRAKERLASDDFAGSLTAEAAERKAELEEDVVLGQQRKVQIVTAYAKWALNLLGRRKSYEDKDTIVLGRKVTDGAIQVQMLKLLICTIDFARLPDEEREAEGGFQRYCKDRFRRMSKAEYLGYEDEAEADYDLGMVEQQDDMFTELLRKFGPKHADD